MKYRLFPEDVLFVFVEIEKDKKADLADDSYTERIMDQIVKQYFAMTPLRYLSFKDWGGIFQHEAQQKMFLSKALHSCHSRLFPVSRKYSKSFLKKLIAQIEDTGCEVIEGLYSEYLTLLENEPSEDFCYKTHYFSNGHRIIMREATSLLSSGTTGLVSWQAAFTMCEWMYANTEYFTGKKILELGCGSGFLGIFACKILLPGAYTFTDCHDKVLDFLKKNLFTNNLFFKDLTRVPSDTNLGYDNRTHKPANTPCTVDEIRKLEIDNNRIDSLQNVDVTCHQNPSVLQCDCCSMLETDTREGPSITVENIDWLSFQCLESLKTESVDIIIGTDLVFDSKIIPSLVNVLSFFLKSKNTVAFISTTIRNDETYGCFLDCLGERNLQWSVMDIGDVSRLLVHDESAVVEIIKIENKYGLES